MKTKIRENESGHASNRPDWEMDDVSIEVKIRLQAVRGVRDSLLQLAYALAKHPNKRAFLLLIDPQITESRLRDEWNKNQMTLRPDIAGRLSIVIFREGRFIGIPKDPDSEYINRLEQACQNELPSSGTQIPAPDLNAEILKILVYQWLMKRGPMTSAWLSETTGCNYRTVAKTLKGLGRSIHWHSDRRVELRYFPKDAWGQMLAMQDKPRATIRYVDRSNQPRSIESLLRRLNKMQMPEVAIGGVLGARHYYPKLDLVGTPRLDLSIHCTGKFADLGFIENLDPALKREDNPDVTAALVLHFIRRKNSFFEKISDGSIWADPVECLLDLQEMRLEPQALEFLNALTPRG